MLPFYFPPHCRYSGKLGKVEENDVPIVEFRINPVLIFPKRFCSRSETLVRVVLELLILPLLRYSLLLSHCSGIFVRTSASDDYWNIT